MKKKTSARTPPRPLERDVLVEAGHRCAIPTCRQIPVEIAHIVPWARVKAHTFDNLIALCPTCHTRYDNGEIDRRAMLQYKANLSVLERFSVAFS
ncbi:MAG TPA: HNH endonuclease signature motif containing protein [Blastocatellia bacterium]|nr:HNH endonuclease signature motif containing protein [Blastocatellia bacterium]